MFHFSTDDASRIQGVPDGPLELAFCSQAHQNDWQYEHPRDFPKPGDWPEVYPKFPLRIRIGRALMLGVLYAFAIYGFITLVMLLI